MSPRRHFFDSRAAKWEKSRTVDQSHLERLLLPFAYKLGHAREILDMGTGTGILFSILVSLAPQARVVGLDLSSGMLAQARLKHPTVSFVQGDVHALPFEPCSFDFSLCCACFPHFEDKSKALEEIRRALRPGGWLLILHAASRATINAIHAMAGGPVARDLLPSTKGMVTLLARVGFEEIGVEEGEDRYLAWGRKNEATEARE